MVKAFDGSTDVCQWIKKVELVAKLKNITDLASFLPLFLEGDALALYLELSEDEQQNAEIIKIRLKRAFAESPCEAMEILKNLRWAGESVDVFANKVKRLAGLAGYVGRGFETTVKLFFTTGFPEEIARELQQVPGFDNADVHALIPRAKVLTCRRSSRVKDESAVAQQSGARGQVRVAIKCFECGGPHLRKDCQKYLTRIVCYRCQQSGHLAKDCPGNA